MCFRDTAQRLAMACRFYYQPQFARFFFSGCAFRGWETAPGNGASFLSRTTGSAHVSRSHSLYIGSLLSLCWSLFWHFGVPHSLRYLTSARPPWALTLRASCTTSVKGTATLYYYCVFLVVKSLFKVLLLVVKSSKVLLFTTNLYYYSLLLLFTTAVPMLKASCTTSVKGYKTKLN
jgi:hypothetical protein